MNRRPWTGTLAAALVIACVPSFAAESAYPARQIHLIVPTVPGTPPDIVARLIGDRLAITLGQPVVIQNRPGAVGTIGLATVARAQPDGYTLAMMALPYLVATHLIERVPFDIRKDFAAVTLICWNYSLLAVPALSHLSSVDDVVKSATAAPGRLKYSSNGNGTPPHLAGELFKREAGLDIQHIPYKGSAAAISALLAGDVDMTFSAVGALAAQIQAGKLRALASAAPHRLAAYPDIPTLTELGFPRAEVSDWQGIVAPAGTSAAVIATLNAAIRQAVMAPEVKERLHALGMEASGAGPAEFALHLERESLRWSKVVRDARITLD